MDRIGRKLRDIAADVAALQRADARLPRRERQEVSLLMAMRDWELSVFRALRRND